MNNLPKYYTQKTIGGGKSLRNSNLEILRIVSMLAIIAHHYVTASYIQTYYDFANPSSKQYFLEVFGMWGKTSINCFVLISGYFLCKGTLTWMRWLQLFAEVFFYHYVIQIIFILTGTTPITFSSLLPNLSQYVRYINGSFTSSFLVFYAFIPILQKVNNCLGKKELGYLCLGLIGMFTIADTFFHAKVFNEPFWYMSLFFIASYIRLYPNYLFKSLKLSFLGLITTSSLAILSVVVLTYFGLGEARYTLVVDSDKILAFLVGLFSFLTFKNIPSFHNKIINFLAEGTFAVYLIHTSGPNMLRWLWDNMLHVNDMFKSDLSTLVIHAITSTFIIFISCTCIDWIRRRYIEKPLFNLISRYNHANQKCVQTD